jgi:hypothetical protein
MAIGDGDLDLLIWLRQGGHLPHPGPMIEIGAQQSHFYDDNRLRRIADAFDVDHGVITSVERPENTGGPPTLSPDAPLSRPFWEWLGFRYASIDYNGTPGAVPLDLNYESIPRRMRGRYDLVTNYGTTEHVANQLNAFKVIHELTAPGGLMLHNLPAQGFCGHGLVNYNLKFFWMLARSNEYQWVYVDYLATDLGYGLPRDIIDSITPLASRQRALGTNVFDAAIFVVLRKRRDAPYVAPLDVDPDAKPPNRALAERYWTVFGRPPPRRRWWRRD